MKLNKFFSWLLILNAEIVFLMFLVFASTEVALIAFGIYGIVAVSKIMTLLGYFLKDSK